MANENICLMENVSTLIHMEVSHSPLLNLHGRLLPNGCTLIRMQYLSPNKNLARPRDTRFEIHTISNLLARVFSFRYCGKLPFSTHSDISAGLDSYFANPRHGKMFAWLRFIHTFSSLVNDDICSCRGYSYT